MPHSKVPLVVYAVALLSLPLSAAPFGVDESQAAAAKETILKASDITPKIFPETVFYRGRVATVQMRNTGGVHFTDDLYLLAGLVDVTGYSSGVREKYQGYLLTEVPVDINGKALKPGAYGIGFVQGSRFIVTDLGSKRACSSSGRCGAWRRRLPAVSRPRLRHAQAHAVTAFRVSARGDR
ncbi:MAG: hypothetical protein DMF84_10400 [Acidobacteria bacterium]|nr:MAG: hypothetical protein DMF84_10400 [Acidobacteriota bacterium]